MDTSAWDTLAPMLTTLVQNKDSRANKATYEVVMQRLSREFFAACHLVTNLSWVYLYPQTATHYGIDNFLDDIKSVRVSPAATSVKNILGNFPEGLNLTLFSRQTKEHIVGRRFDEIDDETYDVTTLTDERLDELIYEVVNNEYFSGEVGLSHHPLHTLLTGLFFDDNWEYLSEVDLHRFYLLYGVKSVKEIKILQSQAAQELQRASYDNTCRGCDNITELAVGTVVMGYSAAPARHVGMPVDEYCLEQ